MTNSSGPRFRDAGLSMLLGVCCRLGLLLWAPGALASAGAPFLFETMGVREGLSQNTVLDVFQDSQGFLWLATENGLNRYNGYEFTHYYRDYLDPGGLRSDYIWAVAEDSRGDLWLASNDAGVIRWDRSEERFQSFLPAGGAPEGAPRRRATSLLAASDGAVWHGTDGAGAFLSKAPQFQPEAVAVDGGPTDLRVTAIAESPSGDVWVATMRGLYRMAVGDTRLRAVAATAAAPMLEAPLTALLVARNGDLWLGTNTGDIARWEPGRSAERLPRPEGLDADARVQDLLEDRDGRVWAATDAGVLVYAASGTEPRWIRHDRTDPFSVGGDDVMTVYQDSAGAVWLGTRGGGASWWNSRSWSFGPRAPQWLSGAHVTAFADGPQGETWMGTIGAGMVRLNHEGVRVGPVTKAAGLFDLPDARVMALLRDRRDRLWIGTLAGGLLRYDPADGSLRSFPADRADPNALRSAGVMSLFEDSQGRVWVGTFNGGVSWIDSADQVHRLQSGDLLENIRPTAITEAPDGEIWIGTDGAGLVMVGADLQVARHIRAVFETPYGLRSDAIYAVHVSEDGDVWIGTAGFGLGRMSAVALQRDEVRFRWVTSAQGLSGNVIYSVLPDDSGGLWLSSNSGISRIDTRTHQVRSYHREHGLYSEEFNFGAYHRRADGQLLFGGPNGFNIFDPAAVETNTNPPRIVLTEVQQLFRRLPASASVYTRQQLELGHADNAVTFEFAITDFTAPEKNVYSYRLVGFDDSWSRYSPQRRISYTNLNPGYYLLEARGINSDGVATANIARLGITVHPAPWATWWAYALYCAAIALALYGYLRFQLRAQERHARYTQLAFYDRLTGMPNRHLFSQRLAEALVRAKDDDMTVAVICVRVTVPRNVSDALGHVVHDEVMRAVAARLVRVVHGTEEHVGRRDIARVDGDLLAVYALEAGGEEGAAQLANRMLSQGTKHLQYQEHRVPLGLHFGIALAPRDAKDAATLLRFAATAARSMGDAAASRVAVYDRAMTARAADRVALESRLSAAIDDDQLQLYFQPRYDSDDRVTGAEALLRWHDDQRGWVSPSEFVPLAEQSDLIHALDSWVIRRICRTLRQWFDAGQETVPIAINLSAANLGQPAIVETLIETCREYHVPPEALEVELTESAVVADVEQVRDSLLRLKQAGFSVALDDFGTGYSSLTHLKEFSIDTVKIDREFVRDVDKDDNQASICGAIAALANSLRMRAVAEGVETQAQWQTLQALGCHEMQGFLKSPAVSEEGFLRHLHNRILPEELPASGT